MKKSKETDTVQRYYDRTVQDEWQRLERHKMEFAITRAILDQWIVEPSRILDIGGGPGRYSLYLSRKGHEVSLLDLSQKALDFAQDQANKEGLRLKEVFHANALDLGFLEPRRYQAVLLFGPLYHLLTEEERKTAVRQALWVLEDDGLIFATFITRYAPVVDSLKGYCHEIRQTHQLLQTLLETGINHATSDDGAFTNAWFEIPQTIQPWMEAFGLQTVHIGSQEGLAAPYENMLNELSDEDFQLWVDLMKPLSTDPHTWGFAEHMIYVGRKSEPKA